MNFWDKESFIVLILTYGRPENVVTLKTLKKGGYSGPIKLVCSDDDKKLNDYKKKFQGMVAVFNKEEIEKDFEIADNFKERRAVVWARNASFKIAKELGFTYFLQLDDDYHQFEYKDLPEIDRKGWVVKSLDRIFFSYLKYFKSISALTVCMSQNGDFIGGSDQKFDKQGVKLWRKAMNSFFCSTQRPFKFLGRINEDVNTYVLEGGRGNLFITAPNVSLKQTQSQSNDGGMANMYLDMGTYYKSFYTVIFAPSCAKIGYIKDKHGRIHHRINWEAAVPKIVSDIHKK